jgi:methyltransferase
MIYFAFVLAVALERVVELRTARRNAAWSREQGGREYGRGHYPVMVILHTGLLAGSLLEVFLAHRAFVPALGWPMVGVVVAAQALRWWCITTLGPQWNTRIIVVPQAHLISTGPYRWMRHPNYLAVIAEGIALPLVHSAWITAAAFTAANAALLRVRIRAEDRALADA